MFFIRVKLKKLHPGAVREKANSSAVACNVGVAGGPGVFWVGHPALQFSNEREDLFRP
jgi:hypothetical protein